MKSTLRRHELAGSQSYRHALRNFASPVSMLATLALCGSCSTSDAHSTKSVIVPESNQPSNALPTTIDWTAIDNTIDPCSDFYQYACGNWQRTHALSDSATIRRRFDDAFYALVPKLSAIMTADASGTRASDDPNAQLIGDFYSSCLNAPQNVSARLDLDTMLTSIMSINSLEDLARQVATQAMLGSRTFFAIDVDRDLDDPTQMALSLDQGGMELHNRQDYLDPSRADLRLAYRQHIDDLSTAIAAISIDADQAIAVETALAQASLEPEDRRDPRALYHPMTMADLAMLAPNFPWTTFFDTAGVSSVSRIAVINPDYFSALNQLLEQTSLPALRSYLAAELLQDKVSWLDDSITTKDFTFWATQYGGQSAPPERSWTCYNMTLSYFGMAISRPYIARDFHADSRQVATDLMSEIRTSLADHLNAASWLDDPTRAAALTKLDAVQALVGYPDEWPNYSGLAISTGSYLMNGVQLSRFSFAARMAALTQPAPSHIWTMSPVTVDAAYDPTQNSVELPAGILAEPFFAPGDAAASNFGGIGAIMGHEMTHGFDDEGRAFDAMGSLRDWWTPAVEQAFGDRAQCLIDQFSSYALADGTKLDGRLTLGENIADLGGVLVAYDALLRSHPDDPSIQDHDNRQQFFLAFAQLYCANERPEQLQQDVMSDPHSPAQFRVNGTLVNVPAFAEAFACGAAAPAMAADPARDLCQIW